MSSKSWTLIGIGAFLATVLATQGQAANVSTPPGKGGIRITAALVDQEMQARPVPLHGLLLVTAAGDTMTTRTDISGEAIVSVPVGGCIVISVAPIRFQGREYRWRVPITVVAGQRIELALTNDNADIEESSPVVKEEEGRGRLDPAAELFKSLGSSVCRVEAGLSHGTGFLADTLGGVILTNAHVVEGSESSNLSIVLDARCPFS